VSVSSLRKPPASYSPADGSYRAVAAPLWRRGFASTIDWTLAFVLFLIGGFPFGMIETLGDAIGGPFGDILFYGAEALALAIVPAYFAYFLATGHTLGMRALDIHVFAHGTGREPHIVRAIARSLLALGFFYAFFKAYTLIRGFHGEDGNTLTAEEERWRDFAVTVCAVGVLGNLWQLADRKGRTLWDRLFGLVVVEDVVPASMPGRLWSPWGT
jgi:uncharacterized RDD family membrane protein YckC